MGGGGGVSESCLFVVIILWPCQALMLLLMKIGEYKNYTPKGLGGIVLYFITGVKKSDGKEGAEYLENTGMHT